MTCTDPNHPRYTTNRLLQAIDDGELNVECVLTSLLSYMSESEVREFARNELLIDTDE